MSTAEVGQYGQPEQPFADGYESPDAYAGQGDTRKIRDLSFSWLVATQDAAGNQILLPRDAGRDVEVSVTQIGLEALARGERHHSFYTTAELERMNQGMSPTPSVSEMVTTGAASPGAAAGTPANINELGPHELAEWIQTPQGDTNRPPTINAVLEAVGNDPDLANRMLEAENIATNGDPRSGLEAGLRSIIEQGK